MTFLGESQGFEQAHGEFSESDVRGKTGAVTSGEAAGEAAGEFSRTGGLTCGALSVSVRRAAAVIYSLVKQGVYDFVLCPGSRNAPLAYVLLAGHKAGVIRLHSQIDERSAGFFALGLIRAGEWRQRQGENFLLSRPDRLAVASPVSLPPGGLNPVVVVTTSGSAPAHLYPALLEAQASALPLMVISADRPGVMQDVKASQTLRQTDLFGAHVLGAWHLPECSQAATVDLSQRYAGQIAVRAWVTAAGAGGSAPGPVHLNMAFEDPLTPYKVEEVGESGVRFSAVSVADDADGDAADDADADDNAADDGVYGVDSVPVLPQWDDYVQDVLAAGVPLRPQGFSVAGVSPLVRSLEPDRLTAVVAGSAAARFAPALAKWCERFGWPLLAEPGSGVRSESAIHAYQLQLAGPLKYAQRLIVVGHPTLSRAQQRYLAADGREVIVVFPGNSWPDVAGRVTEVWDFFGAVADYCPSERERRWGEEVGRFNQEVRERLARLLSLGPEETNRFVATDAEGSVFAKRDLGLRTTVAPKLALKALLEFVSRGEELGRPIVVASSSLVRDLDILQGSCLFALTNRGLAGIDGTLAFAAGVQVGLGQKTSVVLGDCAFVHDMSSLVTRRYFENWDLDIFLFDDAGGSIFANLEHGEFLADEDYDRIFGMGARLEVEKLVESLGGSYYDLTHITMEEAFHLSAQTSGINIMHMCCSRGDMADFRRKILALGKVDN